MKFTLEQKLRTGHVKRWQIVRVAREQTIAEHMYRVYQIGWDIAMRMRISIERSYSVMMWALMHDLPEVVTGDIATPTKRAMRQAVPDQDPVHHIELSLDDEYRDTYCGLKQGDRIVLDIVKLADLLEAINFLMVEGMGTHAAEVEVGLREAFLDKLNECKIRYPSERWDEVTRTYNTICMVQPVRTVEAAYPVTT